MTRQLKVICSLAILLSVLSFCDSARILGLFTSPSRSHLIVHMAIAKTLADNGHDVTVVTTVPYSDKNPNYRTINIEVEGMSPSFMSDVVNKPKPFYQQFGSFSGALLTAANSSLNDPKFQKILAEETYDLVILGYFLNDFQLGVAAHFKCPIIVSFMVQPIAAINRLVGNPVEVSYVPNVFSGVKQPMGFIDRVKNFLYTVFLDNLLIGVIFERRLQHYYNENFPKNKYPSLDEMRKNVSLVLVNHHFSQSPIRPNVPGIIEVGGIQVKEKPNPLPEDIKELLDNAKSTGVVYFSLGSNVKGDVVDVKKTQIFFNVLSKLPQKVLWKWDGLKYPGISDNIVYKKWLPQDDILAHPNLKLFLTHGGQGSIVESQYHGVPLVGIPLFAEQESNMQSVVKSGFGLKVDFKNLNEDILREQILDVLNNPQYRINVQNFAKLYKDRPHSARETALFWVEYVLRHHGAPHLQSPAIHLNGFQIYSLDVIAFLIAILYIVIKIIVFVFRKIYNALFKKKPKDTRNIKKKNN